LLTEALVKRHEQDSSFRQKELVQRFLNVTGALKMKPKTIIYYLSKFTLIDEVLGFLYWAFAIYGIYLIVGSVNSSPILIGVLCVYVVAVVIVYMTLLKKVKTFFKTDAE
jgi:hypothetical protein